MRGPQLAVTLLLSVACQRPGQSEKTGQVADSAAKVQIVELKLGYGAEAVMGTKVSVHYTGTLRDGRKFDSSIDRGTPFEFSLGSGMVIPGWEKGIAGMKVGGKRRLVVPPELGYGDRGAGTAIPPNAVLHFEVELLSVR